MFLFIHSECYSASSSKPVCHLISCATKRLDVFMNEVHLLHYFQRHSQQGNIYSTYCQASFPLFSLHPSLQTFVFGWHHLVISTKLFAEQWFWESWPMKTVSSILIKPYCPLEYRMKKMAIWSTYITGSCRGRCWCPVAVASLPLLLPPPPPPQQQQMFVSMP